MGIVGCLNQLAAYEGGFLLFLQEEIRGPWLDAFFSFITHLGDAGWIWIVLGLMLLMNRHHRREGAAVCLALAMGYVMANLLLKNLVARPRPYEMLEGLTILIGPPTDYSFPSGHTCSSVAAALTILQLSGGAWGIGCCVLAGLIAFSRMYVGVHYPTDVLAGALIGAFAAYLAVKIVQRCGKSKNLERNN